jgi:hypothetical protein
MNDYLTIKAFARLMERMGAMTALMDVPWGGGILDMDEEVEEFLSLNPLACSYDRDRIVSLGMCAYHKGISVCDE